MHRISKLYLSLSNLAARAPASVAEMPDCRGPPLLGAITSILDSDQGKRLHEYVDERHRRHGPLFRGRVGPVNAIFVSSPKAISEVFRIEGPIPQHFVPEAWLLYNRMRNRRRGLLFMWVLHDFFFTVWNSVWMTIHNYWEPCSMKMIYYWKKTTRSLVNISAMKTVILFIIFLYFSYIGIPITP